ncbi:MAG: hypothetical protein KatS3mg053_1560 [Candidatus Roseilinea sp.]|nr:MAG: hypothetical protein KatS3mg053_1560 [Candidatus Roseilinea sp.]
MASLVSDKDDVGGAALLQRRKANLSTFTKHFTRFVSYAEQIDQSQ